MHNLYYSVYYNSVTSTGAIALARALQQNKSLEELKWVQTDCCSKEGFIGMYTVGLGCTSFYWIGCTRSSYNYIQILCAIYLCFISLSNIYTYSLEWDEILWRDIGDEGAVALADPRVFKNFKTLEWVTFGLHMTFQCILLLLNVWSKEIQFREFMMNLNSYFASV